MHNAWGDILSFDKEHAKKELIALSLAILFLAGAACRLPGVFDNVNSEGNVETQVAQTLEARPEETIPDQTQSPTSPPDTATLEPTLTPTETDTPTPEPASVSVTGDTFCRSGPGSVYDQRGIMNTGQESEILAKNPTGNFWYIVNPDDPSQQCWIWGKYATPQGPTAGLPVYTPPPTPTPSLNFSYEYMNDDCGHTGCGLWFRLQNTGGVALESFSAQVDSKNDAGAVISSGSTMSNTFLATEYVTTSDIDRADPGKTVYVLVSGLPNPLGTTGTASMTVCTQDGQGGDCLTKNINFTHDLGSR